MSAPTSACRTKLSPLIVGSSTACSSTSSFFTPTPRLAPHLQAPLSWTASSLSASSNGQARWYWHSAELQKFFNNKTHKKHCKHCGKPSALLLEVCSSCGTSLGDVDIKPTGRDPLVESIVAPRGSADFKELHRSFEGLVVKHKYPSGRIHLLAIPKTNLYDLRQLRRRHIPLLRLLRSLGMDCLKRELDLPESAPEPAAVVGFSYPADFNQLHMHVVVPPFTSLALFTHQVFYSYAEVENELEKRGMVRPHAIEIRPQQVEASRRGNELPPPSASSSSSSAPVTSARLGATSENDDHVRGAAKHGGAGGDQQESAATI
eukprot:CAMPEP_0206625180 /NCGR_PEP_ID=MMETSP0325_2-20121206/64601_1 /ASSEMBLY_ACC=CAM_ASM_000347 /TAXON_ID=2866 /ORGANISM="Crypthecodinium cohnii, Strain Seligo" /LENGTH=318 /DNA_ID=CAMNT_0054149353 /DNA_START=116 /DNA_END=1069 /DNA_ORIENTATION=+